MDIGYGGSCIGRDSPRFQPWELRGCRIHCHSCQRMRPLMSSTGRSIPGAWVEPEDAVVGAGTWLHLHHVPNQLYGSHLERPPGPRWRLNLCKYRSQRQYELVVLARCGEPKIITLSQGAVIAPYEAKPCSPFLHGRLYGQLTEPLHPCLFASSR